MPRIVFCLPPLPSHAAAHGALARELMARGHDCVFLGGPRLGLLAGREGVRHADLGEEDYDISGAGLLRTLRLTAGMTRAWLRHGPCAIERLRPDLVIADQAEPGAAFAAEVAGVRRASLASALPLDRDDGVPPPFVGWAYARGPRGLGRNRGGWRVADAMLGAQSRALAAACREHGLPARGRFDEWISEDLDLRQMVPALDFPAAPAGRGARAVGPLRDAHPADPPEGMSSAELAAYDGGGRPIVFASLGTLAGPRRGLLARICAGAADAGAVVFLAHAGTLDASEAARLPGSPVVRALFPQKAILGRAAACVTHGGLNTVLDCAAARVPMVALPLGFDQPAVAARLAHHGAGRRLTRHATRRAIGDALREVLGDPAYRRALEPAARQIAAAGGAGRAARLVEDFAAGKPADPSEAGARASRAAFTPPPATLPPPDRPGGSP